MKKNQNIPDIMKYKNKIRKFKKKNNTIIRDWECVNQLNQKIQELIKLYVKNKKVKIISNKKLLQIHKLH